MINAIRNALKCRWTMVFLLIGLGLAVRADVPHPTYVYRLRRIGYDVLPDPGIWVGWGIAVSALVLTGMAICLLFRSDSRIRLWAKSIKTRVEMWNKTHVGMRYAVWCVVVCAFAFLLYNVFFKGEVFPAEALHRHDPFYSGILHADDPGWKYEEFVTQGERDELMKKIEAVKGEVQSLLDAEGVIVPPRSMYRSHRGFHYTISCSPTDSSREAALIRILSLEKNRDLRSRCKGIPVDWLVNALRWKDSEDASRELVEKEWKETRKSLRK